MLKSKFSIRSVLFSFATLVLFLIAAPIILHPTHAHAQTASNLGTISPTSGPAGTEVTVTGNWPFAIGDTLEFYLSQDSSTTLAQTTIGSDGSFSVTFAIPPGTPKGKQTINIKNVTQGSRDYGSTFRVYFTVTASAQRPTPTQPPFYILGGTPPAGRGGGKPLPDVGRQIGALHDLTFCIGSIANLGLHDTLLGILLNGGKLIGLSQGDWTAIIPFSSCAKLGGEAVPLQELASEELQALQAYYQQSLLERG